MKKLLILLVFGNVFWGNSQSITRSLLFLDYETKQPIEDVSVFINKTKLLYLSNSVGIVNFELSGNSTIVISHTTYESMNLRSITLKDKNTIYLKSTINSLEEIIITNQHPQKILKNLIVNSISKLTIPSKLKVYSREFFKINDVYSNFNDGLINFQLSRNSKNIETSILVEQNRSYGLVDENINDYLLGYNLNNIMENYYKFKYLDVLLEPKAKKEFDFIVKSYVDNEDYYKMVVLPNQDSKGLKDEFTIVYDHKQKIIIEVSATLSEVTLAKTSKKYHVGSKNITKSFFKTKYTMDKTNYYLVNSKEEIGFEKIKKDQTYNVEIRSYFVTVNFGKQKFSFKPEVVFKDKSLFNKKNVILSNYWETSGLSATSEEELIIEYVKDLHN